MLSTFVKRTPAARVRAVYGGFGIAVAMLLGLSASGVAGLRPGAVVAVGVSLLGMAFGRLVARLFDQPSGLSAAGVFVGQCRLNVVVGPV